MNFVRVGCILFAIAISCAACNSTIPVSTDRDSSPLAPPPMYSWRLPKTILAINAIYTYQQCSSPDGQNPTVTASMAITVSPNYVPDPDLGPYAPDGVVSLDASKLESFWQDRQIEVKTFPDSNILQSFSSTSTDQTGTIVGNAVTGAVKIAAMALGVPTGAGAAPAKCASSATTKQPVTISCLVDPGVAAVCGSTSLPSSTKPQTFDSSNVATLAPDNTQLAKSNWFDETTSNKISAELANTDNLKLHVALDFNEALPSEVRCPSEAASCDRKSSFLSNGAFYRDVAYIPVEIYLIDPDSNAHTTLYKETFIFGQFGTPRSIPVQAHTFGKSSWTLLFANSGQITDGSFGSVAIGTGASSLLGSTETAASSIDASKIKASQTLDSATQAQQLQNTKLQTIIQGATYKQQCQALLAQGQVKSCD
jgi:hypothetical protein